MEKSIAFKCLWRIRSCNISGTSFCSIISSLFMRPYNTKAGTVKWRALLIISALVSLCLSDGVGPRLMPLPVSEAAISSAAEVRQSNAPAASGVPSPVKVSSPRVEMAATAQNRAGDRHQQVQTATHAPQGIFKAPAVIILRVHGADGPLLTFTAPISRPPGRGPPRLV